MPTREPSFSKRSRTASRVSRASIVEGVVDDLPGGLLCLGREVDDIAQNEALLALGLDGDAHVTRGVAGGGDHGDLAGEVSFALGELQRSQVLQGNGLLGDVGIVGQVLPVVVHVAFGKPIAGVGKGEPGLAVTGGYVPTDVVRVQVGDGYVGDVVDRYALGLELIEELARIAWPQAGIYQYSLALGADDETAEVDLEIALGGEGARILVPL